MSLVFADPKEVQVAASAIAATRDGVDAGGGGGHRRHPPRSAPTRAEDGGRESLTDTAVDVGERCGCTRRGGLAQCPLADPLVSDGALAVSRHSGRHPE